ncbi:MAG: GAF domain-containing protein [Chthoniobacterales bacterium]
MSSPKTADKEEPFYAGQTRILEMVASGAPVSDVLTSIVLLLEAHAEGMVCSILLLSPNGKHLEHGAAPSLPQVYVEAVNGAPVGPRNGSCGTAMFLKTQVVVTDVLTDPLWADYRELAAISGFRSCWSTPILSAHGSVLGSFAMYGKETRAPNEDEKHLIEVATHITGIALERKRAEEALRHSDEQLNLLQTITMQVATAKDLASALEVVLHRVCEKTGWDFAQSWFPSRDRSRLELGPAWMGTGDSSQLDKFRLASKALHFRLGDGLPGRVWALKRPIWIEDVTRDRDFPRAEIATESGLKAALAIPILAGDEVIAVIEFFLRGVRPEEERLMSVIAAVAAQLGLAIERKRAEEAVREREARISLAAESGDVAFWSFYPGQNSAWMNEKGRRIYGFDPNLPLTRELLISRVHSEEAEAVKEVFDQVCVRFGTFESEHRLVTPYGKTRSVIMRGRCLHDENGELIEIVGVTIDVTAQKQSELQLQVQREQLAHLNRVALMGEMTASIGHELNQPLAALANNAAAGLRFLERDALDPLVLRELLEDMIADSRRARDVVRGIRALALKDKSGRSTLNLNALIADTVRLVGTDITMRESSVRTELDDNLPQVEVAPVQIQQVLLNLIMNALDALESLPSSQRRIVITTKSDDVDDIAEVSVRDFGTGLPDESVDKVFDHFFSTKQTGMGMGLTIVRSIIEAHGGTITAGNAPGGGALFSFRLPAIPQENGSEPHDSRTKLILDESRTTSRRFVPSWPAATRL